MAIKKEAEAPPPDPAMTPKEMREAQWSAERAAAKAGQIVAGWKKNTGEPFQAAHELPVDWRERKAWAERQG